MKHSFLTVAFVLFGSFYLAVSAQSFTEIPVWPKGAAESNGITEKETTDDASGRIYNTSEASMLVYPADSALNTGIAVILCPGGGYARLSGKYEGTLFAEWYAANGITAVVLKYRLPNGNPLIPLKDAQETVRILRKNAAHWNIDPHKIGISGFSAGGHLASALLTHYDDSCRPDFGILFYPAITPKATFTRGDDFSKNMLGENPGTVLIHQYSNEEHVTPNTPPTLIVMCDDDKSVATKNATVFYDILKQNNVRASLHIFPSGGHGWGFKREFRYHEPMKLMVLDWINQEVAAQI
ncbi:MAG: alpha/beta hydrolase [Candidatus Symbiothrix sp.]|jgi:acetyl esterase/lipase|nr:alpha/beta hydrolase [Candidatus Symbiothrix sp.]